MIYFHFLGEARDPVAAQVLEFGPVEQAALCQHRVDAAGEREVGAGELHLLVGRHHHPGHRLQVLLHRLAHHGLDVAERGVAGLRILHQLRAGADDDGAGLGYGKGDVDSLGAQQLDVVEIVERDVDLALLEQCGKRAR